MTILADAGEVAAARELGPEAMTLRPKDATVQFADAGVEVTLTFDELAREAEQVRSRRQVAQQRRPRPAHVFLEYPSPLPGGTR